MGGHLVDQGDTHHRPSRHHAEPAGVDTLTLEPGPDQSAGVVVADDADDAHRHTEARQRDCSRRRQTTCAEHGVKRGDALVMTYGLIDERDEVQHGRPYTDDALHQS